MVKSISKLRYLAALKGPLLAYVSFTFGGLWAWIGVIYVYALIPVLDAIFTGTEENMSAVEEEIALKDRLFDWMLYIIVPVQYLTLGYFFYSLMYIEYTTFELLGRIGTMGILCSVFGINVAHELGHRAKKSEQFLSKALLLTSLYMHFFIEHNRGHHKNVATPLDPASSRYGEWVYTFWFRSVFNGYISAWNIESERLKRRGHAFFSIHNEMIWYQIIQLAFVGLIYSFFGAFITLCFIAAAVIGFLLLETVNYIEHYGLQRKALDESGVRYEKILPVHSWNSNHSLGRILLFELTRHSDHHYKASRKYQVLRHFEEAPQMPTGYPGMVVLAMIPPLWFYVMHPHIERYKTRYTEIA